MKHFRATTVHHGLLVVVLVFATASVSTTRAAQEAKLLPGDGTDGDNFGRSVALEGDTAMVGSVFDDDNGMNSGSVYVFNHSAGAWTQTGKLLPAVVQDFLLFGSSMSIDGDTVVIGAWGDDQNGDHSGSAFVFTRAGGVWGEDAKLTPTDPAIDDNFGHDVALDGDTALIGAWGDDDNGSRSGSAYVFTRTAGAWSQQAKLLPDDGAQFDRFGENLALDGDTALIGARSNDEVGDNAGAAYVFTRTGVVWTQQAKLVASDGNDSANFGQALAIDGDTAVIGANGDDAAYVFHRVGTVWTEQAKLLSSDGAIGDGFGGGIALEGDTALVAAPSDNVNGSKSGSTYVYTRAAGDWAEQAKLTASDGANGDLFGFKIALEGDTAVITAFRDDDNGLESGSAYVFRPLEGNPVPAHGRAGLALLLMTMLGVAALFFRRSLNTAARSR